MKFQQRKVVTALAYALGVGSVALLTAASAQAADIKVDVTGSNIKRVEGEGATAVTVFTREDIARTGATSAFELLSFVSANQSTGNVALGNVIGATTFSAQTASLRGLGGQATLILVNGKRIQALSGEIQGVYGVNLDLIPFTAIDRVEILTDGASAVYGSDAIGGVINFITRQDFQGVEVTAYGATPTRSGGGDNFQGKLSAGYGDLTKDKYNVFFAASYQEQKALLQSERDFSKTSFLPDINYNTTSGNTFPGYIATGGIGSPDYPLCPSPNLASGGRCRFDPAQYQGVQSMPDQKTTNFYGSGRYQINADWQAYLTGFYSKAETQYVIQPVPLSDQFPYGANKEIDGTLLLPATSPYYPHALAAAAGVDGQPLNVRYRCVECGNRDQTDTNEGWQGVAGVKGTWKNWDMDFDFFYANGNTKSNVNGGFPSSSQFQRLFATGVINPFGPNTPATQQLIQQTLFTGQSLDATSKNYGVEGKMSSDIYNLPAGPLGFAVGFVARKEELSQSFAPILQTGDISGFGGNLLDISASRRNEAGYVEFNVPVVKNLEVNLAVRYDHYSDFGGTTNPKISARWNPTPQLLFRGSWGTGFIAPSLTQLFGANTVGVSNPGVSDPLRCPVTDSSLDCDTQFGVRFGGNSSLQPEKSTQWQVGGVWEPTAGFSIGVDYFNIVLKNSFSNGPSVETILDNLGQYGNLVTRAPSAPPYPNLPGQITFVDQRFLNLGEVKTSGIDVNLQGKFPNSWLGQFSVQFAGTYVINYDVQQTDGSFAGFVSNAYGASATGITPRWKSYTALNWNKGPWAATLANNYQAGYTDYNTDPNGDLRHVGSLSLWDIQGSYTGFKNWTLTAGVKNLFDTNPPLTNQGNTFQSGYDPSYYDARARFVYASVTWSWK